MRRRSSLVEDINVNIAQYEQGCRRIRERIELLTKEIGKMREEDETPMKELVDRRYLLYTELDEMEHALHCLREYRGCVEDALSAI